MRYALSAADAAAADVAAAIVAVVCCFYTVFTQADSCRTVTSELAKSECFEKARSCSTVEDPFKRLLCYDEIYKPVDQATVGDRFHNV